MFAETPRQEVKEIAENSRLRSFLEDLKTFSKIDSYSTKEENMRNCLIEKMRNLGMETQVDEKGNLWVPSSDGKEGDFLLCAHMDKVGAGSDISFEEGKIKGRLDNAVSLSMIMTLLKEGHRPSVLFTVQEESIIQTVEDGKNKYTSRELPEGIYNAGARFANLEIANKKILKNKPKMIINLDASFSGKSGINIDVSSLDFHFPNGSLKDVARILDKKGIKNKITYGSNKFGNDAIEFTFLDEQPSVSMGPYVENPHTQDELVKIDDVLDTIGAITAILEEYEVISPVETPLHFKNFKESKKPIEL